MPVLELLLFGVGVSIGGKRAWRKLTGQEEEEEGEEGREAEPGSDGCAAGVMSPHRSPPQSPRRRCVRTRIPL